MSDDLEEIHTFRCEVGDFKDFLNGKTEYRYEIVCGEKFGENIPINFEVYLPGKEGSKGQRVDHKSHTVVDYIGLKAFIDELVKKPISLMVVPRLLKSDHTIYQNGVSRQIKLNMEKNLNWNQFVKVDTLHTNRMLSTNNKVIIEFDVKLFPHYQPKSILVKSASGSTVPVKQVTPTSQVIPRANNSSRVSTSNSPTKGNYSNGANSKRDKLTNTCEEIVIVDEKRSDVIKLEEMHAKLSTDLRQVLMSADKSDVIFQTKGDVEVKGHGLILAARSQALKDMLADDKKNEDGTWTIPCEDLDPQVMNTILEYIYTGKLELESEFEKNVHQLLIAAHKFQLKELVEYLDLKVPELLTVDNISDFLLLSKQMDLKHLEQVMTKYFVKHRADVVKTTGFLELRENNPGILVDWLLALN